MATLQSYINDTRRLLHDSTGKYWTDLDLTAAINQASRRIVADSSCLRSLQTIYLSPGLETYSYGSVSGANVTLAGSGYVTAPAVSISAPPSGGTQATATATLSGSGVGFITVTNGGSGYTSTPSFTIAAPPAGVTAKATGSVPNINTLDVLNITVVWGALRTILNRCSFTQFQASVRQWTGYQAIPCVCSSYGQSQWYVGPIPDQFYVSEWDTVVAPTDLVNLTDTSPINYPYSDTVAFYAAHIAKFKEQSYAEADKFLELYQRKMHHSIRSVMTRMLPSAYGS